MSKPELPPQYELPEGTSAYNPLILFTPLAVALGQNEGVCNVSPIGEALQELELPLEALPLAILIRSNNSHEIQLTERNVHGAVLRPADQMGTLQNVHRPMPTLRRILEVTKGRVIDTPIALPHWKEPTPPSSRADDLGLSAAYLVGLRINGVEARANRALFSITRGRISL